MAYDANRRADSITHYPFTPLGNFTTSAALASALALTNPQATQLWVQAQGGVVRFRQDAAPTATNGFRILADDSLVLQVNAGTTYTFVGEAGTEKLAYQWGN